MNYLQKFGRSENLTLYFLDYKTQSIYKTSEKWIKGCILSFLKKGKQNHYKLQGLTAIDAKAYLILEAAPQ